MSLRSRVLGGVALLAVVCPVAAGESLEDARRQFLNLQNSLYVKAVDVRPPPEDKAAWGVRLEWEQVPGCPPWGQLSLTLRADRPDGYAFDLFVESCSGPAALAVYLNERDGDRWLGTVDVAGRLGKGWLHVDLRGEALGLWRFGDGKREPSGITGITFEASGQESTAVYWVANLQIHTYGW